jgi:hypothetical protein
MVLSFLFPRSVNASVTFHTLRAALNPHGHCPKKFEGIESAQV